MFEKIEIEKVKGYWDSRPCNIRHSLQPIGTKEYFDEVEARKYFVESHIPYFAEFESWESKKVLEIGCGIGTAAIGFARHGALVSAVDLSKNSLTLAKQRAEIYGLSDRIQFYQANAEDLTNVVPIEAYDLVYSFGVIHHTPNPSKVLEQIRSYVKVGSKVKIMVYYRYSWKVFWILLTQGEGRFWRLSELVAENSEAQTGCPITYIYSRNEICKLLESHGFHATDIWVDHIFPYSIPEYVNYEYVREWYFRWMPPSLFHWLESQIGWHLCVTAEVKP